MLIIALGAGGYFGYDWWTKKKEKEKAEAAAAAAPPPAPAAPAAPKPLPVIPPVWTLDDAAAKIPEGQANGMIAGTNFVVDNARIDRSGTAQVLTLGKGAGTAIERELRIYLHLAAGETLTNHTWTVSQDMKGSAVPQVLKRWKNVPNGPLQQKFISSGYAMKLELGEAGDGGIPGKIFLALPDPEQSIVAGIFKVAPPSAEPVAAQPVVQAPAAAAPTTPNRAAFDRRYGTQKR